MTALLKYYLLAGVAGAFVLSLLLPDFQKYIVITAPAFAAVLFYLFRLIRARRAKTVIKND